MVEILLRVNVGARLYYGEKVGGKKQAMDTDHNTKKRKKGEKETDR